MNSQPPWLVRQARFFPERTALYSGGRTLNYAELLEESRTVAARLQSLGISRGDFVGVYSENSESQFILMHALLLLGAVIVPINHNWTWPEITSVTDALDLTLIIAEDEADLSAQSAPQLLSMSALDEIRPPQFEQDAERAVGTDICAIFFTSGTTGTPRAVPLTWDNFFYSAAGSALNLGIHANDNWLLCLPMDHMGGFSILMRSLLYGTAVTLHRSFDAEALIHTWRSEPVTHTSLVPTMLARILEKDFQVPDSLRAVLLGGGPADAKLVIEALERGVPVLRTYGLTEACSQVTTTPIDQQHLHPESSGKPLAFSDVRIAGEGGVSLPAGSHGEILVRGKTVTAGYIDEDPHSETSFIDHWFRTGDYGFLDEQGWLYTLAREDDLIITGGENVMPGEVESALVSHILIKEASVFGVPDETWGEKVVAAIVWENPEKQADLQHMLRSINLAKYKQPKELFIVSEIPRTSLGKPKRNALKEFYLNRQADAG